MLCPHCGGPTLHDQMVKQDVVVDVCSECHGLWMDRGQIYEFSSEPRALEQKLRRGLRGRQPCEHACPRCEHALERGQLPDRAATVEQCPHCGGMWFDAESLEKAVRSGSED